MEQTRRQKRKKQLRINSSIKKRFYKDIIEYPCCYCKSIFKISNLTIEHIIPLSFGGTNDKSNIDLACAPCNQKRGRETWFLRKNLNFIF